jgi:hypothetical protein
MQPHAGAHAHRQPLNTCFKDASLDSSRSRGSVIPPPALRPLPVPARYFIYISHGRKCLGAGKTGGRGEEKKTRGYRRVREESSRGLNSLSFYPCRLRFFFRDTFSAGGSRVSYRGA